MNREQDRDSSLDRLLGQTLRQGDEINPADCLDTEALAAWAEGSLSSAEHRAAEHHVAGCARCQMILASLAKSEVESAPLEQDALVFRLEREPASSSWWRGVSLRWLVPLAGVATAVAIYVGVPRQEPTEPVAPRSVASAPATPPSEPPSPSGNAAEAPRLAAEPNAGGTREGRAATNRPDTQNTPPTPAPPTDRITRFADADANAKSAAARTTPEPTSSTSLPAPLVSAPPPAGSPSPAAPPPNPAQEPAATARDQTTTVTGAAPTLRAQPGAGSGTGPPAQSDVQAAARVGGAARGGGAGGGRGGRGGGVGAVAAGQAGRGAAPVALVISGDQQIRWRVLPGAVERSLDGGAIWSRLAFTGSPALLGNITTGSSPSSSICWFVGRLGTVLLVTDGLALRAVEFPDTANLTAVQATDARNAVITADNGRRFLTDDGGRTWQPVPPQEF